MGKTPKFRFSASLLDKYVQYIHSDILYGEIYGYSEEPSKSLDEFTDEQEIALWDAINKVEKPSTEAMLQGTAFNNLLDYLLADNARPNQDGWSIRDYQTANNETCFEVRYTNGNGMPFMYNFSKKQIEPFLEVYKEAVPQMYLKGTLPTKFGNVELHGYSDYVNPFCVHDAKTTSKYSVGKYRRGMQHIIYPYCLQQMGSDINMFQYDIAVIYRNVAGMSEIKSVHTETYNYRAEREIQRLTGLIEDFIEFLTNNKTKINVLSTKIYQQ